HAWSAGITTPPTPLLNRVEAAAVQPLSAAAEQDVMSAKLEPFRAEIARRIEVRFDGVAAPVGVSLAWSGEASDIERPLAVILLAKGPVPEAARTVTWRYRLVYST